VSEVDRRREDEWFRQNEEKLLESARVAREQRERERAALEQGAERERLRALHFMRCPKCGHLMKETQLDGIAVDQCSFCEGLYFDAGELGQLFLKRESEQKGFLRRVLGL
jgi:uncharacterized protein